MKAALWQQKSLQELAELDAEISRIEHRTKNLAEQRALAEAHGTYPVPKYMSAAECATIVQNAAGRAMVAPAQ